jgi:hypothetical protein
MQDGERKYHIYARKYIGHSGDFPLLKRRWVLQETFLSPRTLLFGEYELFWQCRKSMDCQCSQLSRTTSYSDIMTKISSMKEEQNHNQVETWHKLVSLYSGTNLSYQTDKLVAVDGLAQWMASSRNGYCIAGLWDNSFAKDLIWSVRSLGRNSGVRTEPEREGDKIPWSTDRWLFRRGHGHR